MSDDRTFYFNINEIVEKGIVSTLYPVFTTTDGLNSHFLRAYLNYSKRFALYCVLQKQGGSRTYMYFRKLCAHNAVIPSVEEQEKIADFIDLLDKRIKLQNEKIECLKKYKRGLVNDVFSQRIATYSERDEWTISPFGEVVTINPKTGSLPDEFIYLDLECVNSGKICAINIIKRENAPSRAQRLLEKNDVLYQMVRPYQQNNYYYANTFPFPIVASTGYAQIKCGACDPLFVYEQISSERFAKEAMLRSTGTSYPAINAEDLGEIPFFLPSIHIQKKIGTFLSLVNQKIFKSEEKLQLLKSAKSSLLQQLFI